MQMQKSSKVAAAAYFDMKQILEHPATLSAFGVAGKAAGKSYVTTQKACLLGDVAAKLGVSGRPAVTCIDTACQ